MTKRIVALLLVVVCMVGIVGSAMAASSKPSVTSGGGKCKHPYWWCQGVQRVDYYAISPADNKTRVRARRIYQIDACTKCGATKRVYRWDEWYDAQSGKWRKNW